MDQDCRKTLARERTDRIGCAWVFISMFDFRGGGSSQKLLTDKKRGSKRITGNCTFMAKHDKPTCSSDNSQELLEGEDGLLVKSETGTLSVRTLIEEEMSAKKEREDDEKTQCRGIRRRRNKTCSKSHDSINVPVAGDDSDDRSVSSLPEFTSCTKNNDDSEEKFSEVIKRLIAQKEGEIQSCKDLLGAFQGSGSKEEPSLPSMEDSQRTEEEEEEEDPRTVEEPIVSKQEVRIGHKKHRFLNRKAKSPEMSSSDQGCTPQSPRTIVILKPGTNSSDIGSSPRSRSAFKKSWNGSRFLLSIIKRILKSAAVKKEPCDDLHVHDDGASETVSDLSQSCCLEEEVHREDTAHTSKDSKKSMSSIYNAAKKHLSEMLENGDIIDVNLRSKEVPRILGRILSLPQFSSPAASPGRTSLTHTAEKPTIQPCSSDGDYSETHGLSSDKLVDEDSDKHHETVSVIDTLISGGDSSTLVEADTMEEIQITDVDEDALEWRDENRDKKPLRQFHETFDEGQSSSSPPESSPNSSVRMTDCQESATDVPGKLSPVSVLEPPFTDDDMSPRGSRARSGEMRMQPLCIRFDRPDSPKADQDNESRTSVDDKESTLAFVKAVIKASGFDWEKLCMKSCHTDQLLEPDLINDIDLCPNQLCNDKKLLSDCINEVLMEFCGNEFGSGPWISFVKPTVWIMSDVEDLVEMAEEEVYWHLHPLPYPHTLDQIVGKDMARTASWMDLRFDTGSVGRETGEIILDELLEESIRSLNRFGHTCTC
ncbi:PREDICTED: uncharacterized protein LOC104802034 [Tarenaya hassleriana]|uniref:uncharacterized protein LOC104802034 n=1 Tax=Tarenaya hassleriana TaxID=28532 RepID=UPI00053C24D9|nr:PREDICTED: uncharacterized protein LOC104802034 [Tarenaya hassleriana]XP_010523756.1 PREDICTED: uncharacterized protein LOC104802034 [Tarenaya hassleriana]XP_010523757.1 PREDICTED: uncharacterized protein LOC104802034 [Tarenaya hassleriana]